MDRRTRYPQEVRERAVRMVFEHTGEHGTQWAAIRTISGKLGTHAELARDRADRRPLRPMLPGVLEDHAHSPFTHFLWVTRSSVHDPILSNDGVSGNPGAIQAATKS